MAQIIFLLLVVGLAWFGYRKFVADAERLSKARKRSEEERRTGANGRRHPAAARYPRQSEKVKKLSEKRKALRWRFPLLCGEGGSGAGPSAIDPAAS